MRPTFLLPLLLIIAANTHLAVWGQETKTSLNRHAFIIGINDYTYEPDLAFCEADAQRLKTVLLHGGFEPQNIDILTGTDRPTKSEIFTRLASLLGKIDDRSENLFLFAFSGHGYQKDGERFLCPYDANRDAGEGLLKLGDVFDVLKKNGNVHHCVFLIDACRSSLNRDKAVHDVDDPKTTSHKTITFSKMDLPEELSVYLLSGCTEGNVAREYAELQQGLFMHYVVEGLEGLAKNRRGEVDGHNLFSFVREGMTSFSSRSGAPQTPTILVSARGEQTKNVAITKPQGVSYWPKRPTAKGATFWNSYADMVQFPGLSGQWWGEEIPWYLPCIRLAVARRLESLEDLRDFDIYSVDSFGVESTSRMNYHNSDVSEAYGWLHKKAVERSRDFLTKETNDLMEKILSLNHDGTFDGGKQGEKYSELARQFGDLAKKQQARKNPVQYAVLLHSQAVLRHLAILHGQGDVDYIAETDKLYAETLGAYTPDDPKTKAPLIFVHLCMSDYLRFLKHIEGKRDSSGNLISMKSRQGLFHAIRGDVSASKAWQSPLFYLELLITAASYASPGSIEGETLFQEAEMYLDNSVSLKPDHPLRAYFHERRAWNLLYAWRAQEAETCFQKARKIRYANSVAAENSLAGLYEIHDRHGTAMARRLQGKIIDQEILVSSTPMKNVSTRGATGSFSRVYLDLSRIFDEQVKREAEQGGSNYVKMLRERLGNTCERWADAGIYGGVASHVALGDKEKIREKFKIGKQSRDEDLTPDFLYSKAYHTSKTDGVAVVFAAKLALALAIKGEDVEYGKRLCEIVRHLVKNDGKWVETGTSSGVPKQKSIGKYEAIIEDLQRTERGMISQDDQIRANLICRLAEIVFHFSNSGNDLEPVQEELRAFLDFFLLYDNDPAIRKSEITEIRLFAAELLLASEWRDSKEFVKGTMILDDLDRMDVLIKDFSSRSDRFLYAERFFDLALRLTHQLALSMPPDTKTFKESEKTENAENQGVAETGQSFLLERRYREILMKLVYYLNIVEMRKDGVDIKIDGMTSRSLFSPFAETEIRPLTFSYDFVPVGTTALKKDEYFSVSFPLNGALPTFSHKYRVGKPITKSDSASEIGESSSPQFHESDTPKPNMEFQIIRL